jgi:hypothetical protein
VNIEAGLASENSGKFISELATEINFKLWVQKNKQ